MKQYIKDLSPEMIISRLKSGEVLRSGENSTIEMIDGFIIGKRYNNWCINPIFGSSDVDDYYFDRPEPEMEIEVGKFYKTRGGNKAFVFAKNSDGKFNVAVEGGEAYSVYQGGFYSEEEECEKDLVEIWNKQPEKKNTDCDKLNRVKKMLAQKYSYSRIAQELGLSMGSIASYIHYYRKKGKL